MPNIDTSFVEAFAKDLFRLVYGLDCPVVAEIGLQGVKVTVEPPQEKLGMVFGERGANIERVRKAATVWGEINNVRIIISILTSKESL